MNTLDRIMNGLFVGGIVALLAISMYAFAGMVIHDATGGYLLPGIHLLNPPELSR